MYDIKTKADIKSNNERSQVSYRGKVITCVADRAIEQRVWGYPYLSIEMEHVDEIQFVILPPVDRACLIRFMREIQDIFQCHIVQMVGSWQDGCAVTMQLAKPANAAGIVMALGDLFNIEPSDEEPMETYRHLDIVKRASSLRRQENTRSKTVLVTLSN